MSKLTAQRDNDTRRRNLINFAIETVRGHHWLTETDLQALSDAFDLTRKFGAGTYFEVNSIIAILTQKEVLQPETESFAAELLARVEMHGEKHGIRVEPDTRGGRSYTYHASYHKIRGGGKLQ